MGLEGFDDAWVYDFAARIYDRNYCPEGCARQTRALLDAADVRRQLAEVTTPVTVIHGRNDRVISFRGGIATATAVPDGELHVYADMGHQLTPHLWDDFVRVISRNAARARRTDRLRDAALIAYARE